MTVEQIGVVEPDAPTAVFGSIDTSSTADERVVFVLGDAEAHGASYLENPAVTCRGCDSTLERSDIDRGDKTKGKWTKSWRRGGEPKCPECGKVPLSHSATFWQILTDPPVEYISPPERDVPVPDGLKKWIHEVWGDRCVAPGCHSSGVEYHHILPRRLGGETTTNNVCPLCSEHHTSPTEPVWVDKSRSNLSEYRFLEVYEPYWVSHPD